MIKAYQDIAEEIRELQVQLEAHAEENGGDITDFPLLSHLEDLEKAQAGAEARVHMLLNLGCMALEYQAETEAMRAQAKRILDAAAKVEKKAAGIMAFLSDKLGIDEKLKDDRVSLSMRKSQAVAFEADLKPEDLPIEYQRIKVEADKSGLTKALKGGQEIPGVSMETRYTLQIK